MRFTLSSMLPLIASVAASKIGVYPISGTSRIIGKILDRNISEPVTDYKTFGCLNSAGKMVATTGDCATFTWALNSTSKLAVASSSAGPCTVWDESQYKPTGIESEGGASLVCEDKAGVTETEFFFWVDDTSEEVLHTYVLGYPTSAYYTDGTPSSDSDAYNVFLDRFSDIFSPPSDWVYTDLWYEAV